MPRPRKELPQTGRPFDTPNAWLEEAANRRKLGANWLSRQLCLDTTQVRHWLSSKEKIPRGHLAELAHLLAPDELHYAWRLKDCEELADQLSQNVGKLTDPNHLDIPAAYVEELFFDRMQILVDQECPSTPGHKAFLFFHYLSAAIFATRAAIRSFNAPYNSVDELVSHENIERHLAYPNNHFVGVLLDLNQNLSLQGQRCERVSSFRKTAIDGLRRQAKKEISNDIREEFSRHHSIHLLAKHGEEQDRDYIRNLVHNPRPSTDPMLRRLGFAGLLLIRPAQELHDQFTFELLHDSNLDSANLLFSVLHYGDISLDGLDLRSLHTARLSNTISHILRHLENRDRYKQIQTSEMIALFRILDLFGEGPFLSIKCLTRLRNLLQDSSGPFLSREVPLPHRDMLAFSSIIERHLPTSLPALSGDIDGSFELSAGSA